MATKEEKRIADERAYTAHVKSVEGDVRAAFITAIESVLSSVAADNQISMLVGEVRITSMMRPLDPSEGPIYDHDVVVVPYAENGSRK